MCQLLTFVAPKTFSCLSYHFTYYSVSSWKLSFPTFPPSHPSPPSCESCSKLYNPLLEGDTLFFPRVIFSLHAFCSETPDSPFHLNRVSLEIFVSLCFTLWGHFPCEVGSFSPCLFFLLLPRRRFSLQFFLYGPNTGNLYGWLVSLWFLSIGWLNSIFYYHAEGLLLIFFSLLCVSPSDGCVPFLGQIVSHSWIFIMAAFRAVLILVPVDFRFFFPSRIFTFFYQHGLTDFVWSLHGVRRRMNRIGGRPMKSMVLLIDFFFRGCKIFFSW